MKKLFLLLFVGVLTVSCSSDDSSDVNIASADLVGTWDVTSYVSETTQTVTAQGITVTSNVSAVGKDFDFTVSFTENPNETTAQGGFTVTATTSIPGQSDVTDEYPLNSVDGLDSGEWSLNNNIITVTNNNTTSTLEVISFNGNVLRLKGNIDDQALSAPGVSVEISGEVFMTLEK